MTSANPPQRLQTLRRVIADDVAGWADLPMLAGIREGTLEPALFRNYLEQDYLYLRNYARLYSRLAAISSDDHLEYFVRLAHGVVAVELDHHKRAAASFECDFDAVVPSVETIEYLAFYDGFATDPAGMLVAMLPCVLGYGIALEGLRKAASGRYQNWIDIYTGTDYANLVERHLQMINDTALPLERCVEITEQALQLERRFWNQVPAKVDAWT